MFRVLFLAGAALLDRRNEHVSPIFTLRSYRADHPGAQTEFIDRLEILMMERGAI
jgi:hypothetical protein